MVDSATNVNLTAVEFDPFAGPDIVRLAPSTEPQQEVWTSCQLGGDDANRAYNESVSLLFNGPLNRTALEQAWHALIRRHEALNSAFNGDGQQICVFREVTIDLAYQDLSTQTDTEKDHLINEYVRQDALHRFDLINGPLIKAGLIKLSDTNHHFTLTAHHIVCDGWSLGILLQDLSTLYSAYAQNLTPTLPAAPLYSQYAAEQVAFLKSKTYQQVERFWLSQYKETVPVLNLPTDFPRPDLRTYKSKRQDYRLEEGLAKEIKQIGIKAGCSFITTLMAAFEVFLHRVTGQDDIVLGVPTAGQSATGNQRLVGHCVNLLPLRSHPQSNQTFLAFLKQRKEAVLDAYEHQQLTFGSLLKKLNAARDPSRVPLVPVLFNVDMGLADGVAFHGLDYQLISNPRQFETVDLFLNIGGPSISSLTVEWSYNTQLFKGDTIDRMMTEFERLLKAIVANPTVLIGQIPLTDQSQLHRQLTRWNNTAADYPRHTPLHQLLAQTAATYAGKTALIVNQKAVSYQTLDQTANQLAHYLQRAGIGVGSVVGIMLDRSPELLIALLAVLKSGAAYVPIDPEYPQDRIAFMLADSSAGTLITSQKYRTREATGQSAHQATELVIEAALAASADYAKKAPELTMSSSALAYILYTSGSTGRPKGVLIEHRNLVNLLYSMLTMPGITPEDVLLGVTTVSFDIAGLELFLPLLVGATLVLADAETAKDGVALLQTLTDPIRIDGTQRHITLIQATPVTYKMILAAGWEQSLPLKVLCCGEPMSKDLAQKLTARCDTLWNMYGPTETTIYSTGKQILASDELITIGRPINNTQIYILDEQLNPLSEGIVGEIYIGGDGVARGYLNRPDLTAEKFVNDPFATSGQRIMYRTGDLGKFTADGEIHCLGRIDQQVKVRGYRIELGEIDHALVTQPGVKEALVMAREDRPGDQRLTAYIIPTHFLTEADFTNQSLVWRTKLLETLPGYMVPTDFIPVNQWPVTPNGKIDRKALPKPGALKQAAANDQSQPTTDTEKLIASVWADALGLSKINVYDDFFELGGHSLIAVQVMTRLEKETGRRLPVSTLLAYPTIHKLAPLLQDEKQATPWKSLVPIKPQGSKVPIYIIHGIGLNLLNFSSLVAYMDPEQPIYGLQARGLDGTEEPLDSMEAIAACYNAELLEQNPSGPYAIAGYSFGGYVALEMARQLKAMGKEVKMLAMFDTNAEESTAHLPWPTRFSRKVTRQWPKLIWFGQSLLKQPATTMRYQWQYVARQVSHLLWATGLRKQPYIEELAEEVPAHINRIMEKHEIAYQNYSMKPYDGTIDLFKAQIRVYFVEDKEYLGWRKYARQGVRVHDVPGDHKLMLLPPNDQIFARALQQALDSN